MSDRTDADLLTLARCGDRDAFKQLVERYESLVAATVVGMLGRGPEAEDVAQSVFIRFYKAIDQFRGEATLATYLTRIAMNLSLNEIKRQKRWNGRFVRSSEESVRVTELSTSDEPLHRSREVKKLIDSALDRLDPKFRSVVVLRMIQGYSTAETASLLNIPTGTVLSRLSRAQTKLKTLLEPVVRESGL